MRRGGGRMGSSFPKCRINTKDKTGRKKKLFIKGNGRDGGGGGRAGGNVRVDG
jgi:hypothetical protein